MRGAGTQTSLTRSAPSSQAWMIRHLSCPRDWKSSSGDLLSSNSKKNLSESLPVGPAGSTDCRAIQRSHSSRISAFASFCFIAAHSRPRDFRGGEGYRAGRGYGEKVSAPPRTKDTFVVTESNRNLLNLSELLSRVQNGYDQRIPFCGRNFDSDSDDFPAAAWLG